MIKRVFAATVALSVFAPGAMAQAPADPAAAFGVREFEGLDHQLEDSAARARLLRDSDAFLRRALGMQ